ncbi:MAG TPA: amidohydrolase family protein [archaeon]|nr:amidohydrolase family protein [archaeon]
MSAKFRLIDAHTHIEPQWAGLALRVMDRCNIACSVNAGWMNAYGGRLREMLEVFNRYPGRFAQLCNIDWRGVGTPDFGKKTADDLEAAIEAGAKGLKIFKSLGLEVRDPDGKLLRVDDRRLDPVFERAGALRVPVLIHTADPSWFWRPLGPENFWSGVLEGPYAEWSYYRKGFPSREELLSERDNLVERHRDTTFVAPHLASLADDPLTFREALQTHPNLYADISARLPAMARTEERRQIWREILIQFAGRILFGTDLIYLDADVKTGIQSQSFQRPEDVDLSGLAAGEAYEKTSAAYVQAHVRFLSSQELQQNAPFRRQKGGFPLPGLGLPEEALKKIFYEVPAKIYGVN